MVETKPVALIIEDNEDQNWIFTMAVQKAGYETESIFDGRTAQRRLAEIVPHFIVLDLHMPDVNGSVILEQIRADPRLANVIVILATADSTFAESMQSQTEMALLKPVSFSQLSELALRFNPHPNMKED